MEHLKTPDWHVIHLLEWRAIFHPQKQKMSEIRNIKTTTAFESISGLDWATTFLPAFFLWKSCWWRSYSCDDDDDDVDGDDDDGHCIPLRFLRWIFFFLITLGVNSYWVQHHLMAATDVQLNEVHSLVL